jgi:heme-degrading monooxygenase HmoA
MIVRLWRGQTTRDNADAYHAHVTQNVFPVLTEIGGHKGSYLLTREVAEGVEFLAVTLWESLEAVRQFAGDDMDEAVVEPEARAVLAEFDRSVRHFQVTYGHCGQGREDLQS